MSSETASGIMVREEPRLSMFDAEPGEFAKRLAVRAQNRDSFLKWLGDNLKEGVHFWRGPKKDKPSLLKGGAEEITQRLGLRLTLRLDKEMREWLGAQAEGWILYAAFIDGVEEPVGRGSACLKWCQNDINKCVKMAQKSAKMDAVLSIAGVSALYTQDMEEDVPPEPLVSADMPTKPLGSPEPEKPVEPVPVERIKEIAQETAPPPKRRGRPPGSKNNPAVTQESLEKQSREEFGGEKGTFDNELNRVPVTKEDVAPWEPSTDEQRAKLLITLKEAGLDQQQRHDFVVSTLGKREKPVDFKDFSGTIDHHEMSQLIDAAIKLNKKGV